MYVGSLMTHYEDLAPVVSGDLTGLAVGWLDTMSTFPTAPPRAKLAESLVRLAANPQRLLRGLHYCPFCDAESPIEILSDWSSRGRVWLGNGEIHVADDHNLYIAPTLIVHYITEHWYKPPDEFVGAVTGVSK